MVGLGHKGEGSSTRSAQHSQLVQTKEKSRQSASLAQGLWPQKLSVQALPGSTQVPQLALQHSFATEQVTGPQRGPLGAVAWSHAGTPTVSTIPTRTRLMVVA